MKKLFVVCCLLFSSYIFSQDLLSMVDSVQPQTKTHDKVFATFKALKLINAQTIETTKKNHLDFRIAHRFGDIATNGAGHTLYGWDAIADVRFSFDFGITDKIMIGAARNKRNENIDGTFKWRFLEQTSDDHVPLSVALYENAAFTPMDKTAFYSGTIGVKVNTMHRLSYTSQVIIARKFNRAFSFELLPTYQHRNFVKAFINPGNGAEEMNDLFALGAAVRIKLNNRFAIVADYFYNFSHFRMNNTPYPYYNVFAIGFEWDTGGHIFHIDFSNAPGIIENDFLVSNPSAWSKGAFKFGFNISRVFSLKKK